MKEMMIAILMFLFPVVNPVVMNMVTDSPPLSVSAEKKGAAVKQEVITIIGDSLTVAVSKSLKQMKNKKIYIDAKVGRQMNELSSVFQTMKKNNKLGSKLVIALGTNGSFRIADVQAVINIARKSGVDSFYVVNVCMQRSWQNTVNQSLSRLVQKNKKDTQLIDWYQVSKDQKSYFAADGVHLSKEGQAAFVRLIQKSIA